MLYVCRLFCTVGSAPVMSGPPHGQPLPPEYGPPPYEATMQPGFVPPHVPGEDVLKNVKVTSTWFGFMSLARNNCIM